jgi:hypothetical protein
MSKSLKIITAVVLVIAVFLILRGGKSQPQEFNDSLADLNQPPAVENVQPHTIDFSKCSENDSFSMTGDFGSGSLKILGPDNGNCKVETRFEVEGGFYTNECQIPQSVGTLEFNDSNFENISSYCELKTQGGGMLDLKK